MSRDQIFFFFSINFCTKLGWSGPSNNFSNRYGLTVEAIIVHVHYFSFSCIYAKCMPMWSHDQARWVASHPPGSVPDWLKSWNVTMLTGLGYSNCSSYFSLMSMHDCTRNTAVHLFKMKAISWALIFSLQPQFQLFPCYAPGICLSLLVDVKFVLICLSCCLEVCSSLWFLSEAFKVLFCTPLLFVNTMFFLLVHSSHLLFCKGNTGQ